MMLKWFSSLTSSLNVPHKAVTVETPMADSEFRLANEKCLKRFLQTDGLTSCNGQQWQMSAISLIPTAKPAKGSSDGLLAFSLPLIRVELTGLFFYFFLAALSVGITLVLTVSHLYGPDASSPTGILTVIKCCYVLDLRLLVRLMWPLGWTFLWDTRTASLPMSLRLSAWST